LLFRFYNSALKLTYGSGGRFPVYILPPNVSLVLVLFIVFYGYALQHQLTSEFSLSSFLAIEDPVEVCLLSQRGKV
jgi:hypothetical protein